MSDQLIITILILSFIVQLAYLLLFLSIFHKNKRESRRNMMPVSVIICAKDESANLKKFLPSVAEQSYPDFELIVVNDGSTDNSLDVLNAFSKEYDNLTVLNTRTSDRNLPGKKYALTYGIEHARNDIILLTDADCFPRSSKWIRSMISHYSEEVEIVLGYGAYEYEKGFLNALIRTDTILTALQYLSFAKVGIPYMGVGRNLSYKRKLFPGKSMFEEHSDLMSGDDDLFVQKVAYKRNTGISLDPNSVTFSKAKTSFYDWVRQKKRHLTTGVRYKFFSKLLLFVEPVSKFAFYLFVVLSVVFQTGIWVSIVMYVIRLFILSLVTTMFTKRMNEKSILIFIPIFDFLIPLLNFIILTSNLFVKNRKWK